MRQFQQIVQQFFKDFGRLVAKWPLLFIVCSSAAALALTTAGFVANTRSILSEGADDQYRLFLPENAESIRDFVRLRSLFPVSARDAYDVFQSAYAYVVVAADDGDGDVLREEVLRSVAEIVDRVKRIRVRVGWMEASWSTLCAGDPGGGCWEHPLLSFLNASLFADVNGLRDRIAATRHLLTYPAARFGDRVIDNSLIFGSVATNEEGEILKAGALRIPFALRASDGAERRALNERWQREFVRVVRATRFPRLSIYVSSSSSWKDEMDRNGDMLTSYLPALFAVLLVFSVICCCTTDWVRSQPWLGFCGLLSAVLAVSSAFGVLFYFQYQYLRVVVIMPFLVLSVSADNAFLMLNAWRNSSGQPNVEARMSSAISQSAVSILITALTDGLSFAVGSASQFPAVRIFCTYCAVAILFSFIYQTTFFAACLAFCGRRELANRHCLTLRRVDEADGALTGANAGAAVCAEANADDGRTISLKFSALLAAAMENKFVKFLIVLLYVAYLASAIYGLTNSQLRLDMSSLVPSDSYMIAERRATEVHFSNYSGYAQAVVFVDKLESSFALLIDLYERLCDTEYSSTGEFWLSEFSRHVAAGRHYFTSEADLVRAVKEFLDVPSNSAFRDDVAWSPSDDESIVATRMFIRLRRAGGGNRTKAAQTLRRRFSESRLRGFITDLDVFPLADQSDAVLGCVLQDAAIATGVIIAVVLVFLPKLLCAVCIGLSILSINVGVLGYLALWRVRVDVVSMMTTVMSVGLSVDYVAHITYHYLITKRVGGPARLRGALEHAGWSSVQSAAATILGASTLAFVDSYMVRTFVKTVILVVSLGLLHGLIFLPTALSAFVRADQHLEENSYSRVRAYVSAAVPRAARGRLAAYLAYRVDDRDEPSPSAGPVLTAERSGCSVGPKRTPNAGRVVTPKARPDRVRPLGRTRIRSADVDDASPSSAWTSTASKSLLAAGRNDGRLCCGSHPPSSPVYDSPPHGSDEGRVPRQLRLSPELLSEARVGKPGEVVEIVLKSKRSSEDCSEECHSGLLKTFQPVSRL